MRIWEVSTNKLLHTLETNDERIEGEFECLRVAWAPLKSSNGDEGNNEYLLASAGADGILRLWQSGDKWKLVATKDHHDNVEEDRPQIYALQFVGPKGELIMTSANDALHFWRYSSNEPSNCSNTNSTETSKVEVAHHLSLEFDHIGSNQFGGPRNPNNNIFVFDSCYNPKNECVAVALSDGTCRIVSLPDVEREGANVEGHGQCALALPPAIQGHLTAVNWDSSGSRLAACIASGKLVMWVIQIGMREGRREFYPSCIAALSGGECPMIA